MSEAANELSVREKPSGGDVADAVAARPAGFPQGRGRLVLLLHGYNNNEAAARASYSTFRENMEKRFGPAVGPLLADTADGFWPGDARLGKLSFASYPTEIKPAERSGQRFARFIAGLVGPQDGPIDLYIIAHSLGNRVALELLREFSSNSVSGKVVWKGVCLMAAAVPVKKIEWGEKYNAAARLSTTLTLFSTEDKVLRFAFPAGETFALDGFFPTAVGRFGEPGRVWSRGVQMAGYDHGDYWKKHETILLVARFLGVSVPNEIAGAQVPASGIDSGKGPSSAAINSRTITRRRPFG